MSDMRFTKDHEWIRVDGTEATVGITAYASQQLGDIVFVETPQAGTELAVGVEAAVVESVKAASEVYSPVSGMVVCGNEALGENPALVNESPEGDGWFFKMSLSNASELDALMDAEAYQAYVAGLE